MSLLSTLGAVASELAEHEELIELVVSAVRDHGVDRTRLVEAIKAEMTRAGAEALRRELEG